MSSTASSVVPLRGTKEDSYRGRKKLCYPDCPTGNPRFNVESTLNHRMKECKRQFGPINCGEQGEGVCATALNEALNEGNINDRDSLLKLLRLSGFNYVLRFYVIHSIDSLTDPEVIQRIPASYRDCIARYYIADAAQVVLEEMTEDKLGNLDILGRISFGLPIED